MIWLIWLIFGLVAGALLVIAPWFFMLARLKNMGYSGATSDVAQLFREFGALTGISVLACALVGVLADVIFNAVYGSIIFREWPRELMFTARVKRWDKAAAAADARRGVAGYAPIKQEGTSVAYDYSHRELMGLRWARRLNRIMPGHV